MSATTISTASTCMRDAVRNFLQSALPVAAFLSGFLAIWMLGFLMHHLPSVGASQGGALVAQSASAQRP